MFVLTGSFFCLCQLLQISTLDRKNKNKNFSFSRRFPFMKNRDDVKNEDGSDQERELFLGLSSK